MLLNHRELDSIFTKLFFGKDWTKKYQRTTGSPGKDNKCVGKEKSVVLQEG